MTKKGRHKEANWRFHLTGGVICLDFANTLSWRRGDAPIERLGSYRRLIDFCHQSKIIDAATQRALRMAASAQPRSAANVYRGAIELRALIDRIFTSIVVGTLPASEDLSALNARLIEVSAQTRVIRRRGYFVWDDAGKVLTRVLAPIVRSTAALLTSPQLAYLRRCGAADCGWLFVDTSRNRQRRWCDMRVCGNRAKARAHQRRVRKLPSH